MAGERREERGIERKGGIEWGERGYMRGGERMGGKTEQRDKG